MWTRRALLKAGGLALLSLGVSPGPSFLTRTAAAAATPGPFQRRKTLVALFQRGAMDGLAAVSPLGDPHLARLRPRLALSGARSRGDEPRLLDLEAGMDGWGGGFGLHPAFDPLLPLWREERLAVVHAVGSPDPTRSHFDAQDYMETGTPGRKSTSSGWLNRVAGRLGHEASPFRATALTSALPRSLHGPAPALAVADLESLRVRGPLGGPLGRRASTRSTASGFEALYDQTSQALLHDAGKETFDAVALLEDAELRTYRPRPGVSYPQSPLGQSLRQVAMLVKGRLGLEVAFVESGGWDTHVQQGSAVGSFARRSRDLAASIAAFWRDLGTYQDDVVLLTMTEFGRTVAENGSAGTDHGHGSCLFLLGNAVDGGRIHGNWPGLAPGDLHDGRDLPVTTDFRAVFQGLATGHLGVTAGAEDDAALFPGWAGGGVELLRRG